MSPGQADGQEGEELLAVAVSSKADGEQLGVPAQRNETECPGTHGKIVSNNQECRGVNSQGCWVLSSRGRGLAIAAKEAAGWIGPGRVGFAERVKWKDQGQGGEVHSWI